MMKLTDFNKENPFDGISCNICLCLDIKADPTQGVRNNPKVCRSSFSRTYFDGFLDLLIQSRVTGKIWTSKTNSEV